MNDDHDMRLVPGPDGFEDLLRRTLHTVGAQVPVDAPDTGETAGDDHQAVIPIDRGRTRRPVRAGAGRAPWAFAAAACVVALVGTTLVARNGTDATLEGGFGATTSTAAPGGPPGPTSGSIPAAAPGNRVVFPKYAPAWVPPGFTLDRAEGGVGAPTPESWIAAYSGPKPKDGDMEASLSVAVGPPMRFPPSVSGPGPATEADLGATQEVQGRGEVPKAVRVQGAIALVDTSGPEGLSVRWAIGGGLEISVSTSRDATVPFPTLVQLAESVRPDTAATPVTAAFDERLVPPSFSLVHRGIDISLPQPLGGAGSSRVDLSYVNPAGDMVTVAVSGEHGFAPGRGWRSSQKLVASQENGIQLLTAVDDPPYNNANRSLWAGNERFTAEIHTSRKSGFPVGYTPLTYADLRRIATSLRPLDEAGFAALVATSGTGRQQAGAGDPQCQALKDLQFWYRFGLVSRPAGSPEGFHSKGSGESAAAVRAFLSGGGSALPADVRQGLGALAGALDQLEKRSRGEDPLIDWPGFRSGFATVQVWADARCGLNVRELFKADGDQRLREPDPADAPFCASWKRMRGLQQRHRDWVGPVPPDLLRELEALTLVAPEWVVAFLRETKTVWAAIPKGQSPSNDERHRLSPVGNDAMVRCPEL